MSWDYACKLEEQLKQEVATLLAKAESESSRFAPNSKLKIINSKLQSVGA